MARGLPSLIKCGPILGGFNKVTMQTCQGTDTGTGGKIVASNVLQTGGPQAG